MPPLAPCPFPDDKLTRLWDEIVRKLSTSPELTKVKSAEMWQGGATSVKPFAFEELPGLRVTPAAGTFQWADECRFDGPLVLKVRIAVKGLRARDLMNFWAAIARALSPTSEYMQTLQPLGCYNLTMTVPAIEPKLCCEGQGVEAEGYVTLKTNVNI